MKAFKTDNTLKIVLFVTFYLSISYSQDNLPASQNPPGGLKPEQCPMFVCFGFDDNAYIDGVKWFADLVRAKKNPAGSGNPKTYDGAPVRATFFLTAGYGAEMAVTSGGQTATDVLNAWKGLVADGHEIANHTYSHPHGASFSKEQWKTEMTKANTFYADNLSIPSASIKGFRNPFLEISTGTYEALKDLGFYYDCSIEAGYGSGWPGDGTGGVYWWSMADPKTRKCLFWPYTLDNGPAPGIADAVKPKIAGLKLNGLWELTCYTYLRATGAGEITGFDFNLWKQLNKSDFVNILKYNFDLQHTGNRCPITINAHTDNYSQYNDAANTEFTLSKYADRRQAIEEFLAYVLTFSDVRVVSYVDLIKWMKSPASIGPTDIAISNRPVHNLNITVSSTGNGISLSIPENGVYTITLVSPNGRAQSIAHERFLNACQSISIRAEKASGMYVLQVDSGAIKISRKILIP